MQGDTAPGGGYILATRHPQESSSTEQSLTFGGICGSPTGGLRAFSLVGGGQPLKDEKQGGEAAPATAGAT